MIILILISCIIVALLSLLVMAKIISKIKNKIAFLFAVMILFESVCFIIGVNLIKALISYFAIIYLAFILSKIIFHRVEN